MRYTFTAVYLRAEDGGIDAYVEELFGVVIHAATMEAAERDLREAAELMIACNRRETAALFRGCRVVRRVPITVGSPEIGPFVADADLDAWENVEPKGEA